jgi:hypothetical protein
MPATLNVYALFHLNIAFSSIDEERRPEVVRQCYWPLLRLAEKLNAPIGLEATGYTLEQINNIDPDWMILLRHLQEQGLVEFIGSGYAQIIGPLTPGRVVQENLHIGNDVYMSLLGEKPQMALVNEQAYSGGLVGAYREAGYQAIIMDYDNLAAFHPEWQRDIRYRPQIVRGADNRVLPLVWTNTVAFQKLQRFAHGDIEIDEYLDYVRAQKGDEDRTFPLYGNDVEIFDFRPGRLATEDPINAENEWDRLACAFERIRAEPGIAWIAPSKLFSFIKEKSRGSPLQLETAEYPVPVKKQRKYNVTRWAVSGRNDLQSNSACWAIYKKMLANENATADDWKSLCYLWSSDFRTHITHQRWDAYQHDLKALQSSIGITLASPTICRAQLDTYHPRNTGKYVEIVTDAVHAILNTRRGLAIHKLWFGSGRGTNQPHLCGTLPHGFFDDIGHAADWYSGSAVWHAPGAPKVTDLESVEPRFFREKSSGDIVIEANIETRLGPIEKLLRIKNNVSLINVDETFLWTDWTPGSLRVADITLNPLAYNVDELSYRTHNGGDTVEEFEISGKAIEHGAPISLQVSATCALGMTEGWIDIGDRANRLRLTADMTQSALIGMVTHRKVDDQIFCRLSLSASEFDETLKPEARGNDPRKIVYSLTS